MILIRTPIWKTRSVGLNEERLEEQTKVKITYRDRTGQELFPNIFTISRQHALTFPRQVLKSGVALRIIPIREFSV